MFMNKDGARRGVSFSVVDSQTPDGRQTTKTFLEISKVPAVQDVHECS